MKFQKLLFININKDSLDQNYWDEIDKYTEKSVFLSKDAPDFLEELADADGLLVNFGVEVTKEHIDTAKSLKYIGVIATAYGKIDIEYAKQKNIPVSNVAGYSTESVAEFTIGAILENIRSLETGKQRGREGNYSETGLSAREIKGAAFGVLGLGNIGKRVAELARGFDADVRYWSKTKKETNFTYQDLDALLGEADFISINFAQNLETEGLFDSNVISKIKKGSVMVNTAPMELFDIDALADRLKQGDFTFILDHSDEMTPEDLDKLSEYDNCIIYPPIAYITDEARTIKQKMFVRNIGSFLEGSPENIVNA